MATANHKTKSRLTKPGFYKPMRYNYNYNLKKISTQIKVDRKGKGNFRGRKAVVSTKPINSDKRSKFMSTKMTLFACPPHLRYETRPARALLFLPVLSGAWRRVKAAQAPQPRQRSAPR